MDFCPRCQRKLITHASPKCNWCGEEIEDAAYQQLAQTARDEFFNEQAQHDAISQARIQNINVFSIDPQLNSVTYAALNPNTVRGRALRCPSIAKRPVHTVPYQDSVTPPSGFEDVEPTPNDSQTMVEQRFNHLELG
jgi:hypothetical protein